jgi:hypothetical protein
MSNEVDLKSKLSPITVNIPCGYDNISTSQHPVINLKDMYSYNLVLSNNTTNRCESDHENTVSSRIKRVSNDINDEYKEYYVDEYDIYRHGNIMGFKKRKISNDKSNKNCRDTEEDE